MAGEPTLIDGVKRNQEHPDTFQIPSEIDRLAVKLGDFVKIGLETSAGGERFWVEVTEVRTNGDMRLTGAVANDLTIFPHIALGSEIHFSPEHILAIL